MEKLKQILREINQNLDLPQPLKASIIIEIAADFKDALAAYIEEGYSEEEAVMKVKNMFDLSKKSLDELKSVHQTPFRKWFDHLSTQAQTKIERIIFIVLILIVFVTGILSALNTSLFNQSGIFIWGVLFALLCATALFFLKLYQIYIKKDHTPKKLRSGVSSFLFLSGLSIFICVFGYYWDLYTIKSYGHLLETELLYLIVTTESQLSQIYRELLDWMINSSAFIMISMLVTIVIASMWFFLMSKISRIEAAEAEALLAE